MPTYDFHCEAHGSFSAMRSIAQRDAPCLCPACGQPAARQLISAPAFADMPGQLRSAHATNERARHEPRLASRTHGPGCSCCSGKTSKTTAVARDGSKAFPTKRPWMISH